MKDRKRDHFMTKEERAELWRKWGEKREKSRIANRGEVPRPVDYEIYVNENGDPILICPWRQELPAGGANLFFWNILEELRKQLEEESQDEFLAAIGNTNESSRALLRAFSEFALDGAKAATKERHDEALGKIEDVRLSVGYYDGENNE